MNQEAKKEKKQEVQKAQPARSMMSPERYDLFQGAPFFREMERFFDDFLPRRWWHHGWGGGLPGRRLASPFEGKMPNVDVIERDDEFIIKAELPGVDKKDINITLAGNTVTLEAKVDREKKEEKENYYHREICQGSFMRTLDLPSTVDEGGAKASFKNGILELTLPKTEKTKRLSVKVE